MKKEEKKHLLAVTALFLSAFFWGSATCVLKDTLNSITPFYLLAIRFLFAGGILVLLFIGRLKYMTKTLLLRGVLLGIFLFFEFAFFTVGIQYTTASKSSFLIASYIMIIPFVYWIICKKRPTKYAVLATVTCMCGLVFILFGDMKTLNKGDIYSIICALFYAVHIVYTGKFVREEDGILLNVVQILTGGFCSLFVAVLAEPFPTQMKLGTVLGMVYLAVGCTIIPYVFSMFGQKYTKTTTAAVILSFESVFACLLSIITLGEHVTIRFMIGGALVVGSFVVSEKES